ncbi:unnamed protein product [Musa acuminata var. zebrina]
MLDAVLVALTSFCSAKTVVVSSFQIGSAGPDSQQHVFFEHPFSLRVWDFFQAKLHLHFNIFNSCGEGSWLKEGSDLFPSSSNYSASLIAYSLWLIWTARNDVVFQNVCISPLLIAYKAVSYLYDSSTVTRPAEMQPLQLGISSIQVCWSRPAAEWIKLNMDGAFEAIS